MTHVDVAFVPAYREGGDEHTLDKRMGVVFEHGAVHERARVTLVTVADDVVPLARVLTAEAPLLAGGEAGTATAAEPGALDLVDDPLRIVVDEHLREGPVAATGEIVVDRGRVDEAVDVTHDARLPLVEGDVLLESHALAAGGVHVEETLDDAVADHAGLDDLGDVAGLESRIEDTLRVDDDDRAFLAEPVTAGEDDLDPVAEAALLELGRKGVAQSGAPGRVARRSRTDADLHGVVAGAGEFGVEGCLERFADTRLSG